MIEVNGFLIQEDIQNILTELRVQLALNGIERFKDIKKSGNNLQCTCPFHKDGHERRPSFGILLIDRNGKKAGTGHCMTCGWAGSLPEMISNCFGKDDFGKFGNQWLVKNFLSIAVERRPDIELGLEAKNEKSVDKYVTEEELDSYRWFHPYMYKRGLTDWLLDLFDIGYDKKTECLTFPNKDVNGNTLFIARRSVKTKYFNYPQNVDKPLYGLYEMKLMEGKFPVKVYLTESMLDALSFWRVDKYALAFNGQPSENQLKMLRQLDGVREYVLATDCDKWGLKFREKIQKALPNKIIKQVFFPTGKKDANDCNDEELENLEEVFM